jgi:tryptophan 2,3-dioxygenase
MVYYHDYLHLDSILGAQELESDKAGQHAHEEMLFIITHQAFELWFKQVLFELASVITKLEAPYVPENEISVCQSRLIRVNRIMEHLCDQFTLIETMTPGEFMDFRAFLNPASGFQSMQFRILERKLGLSEDKRILKRYTDALSHEHRTMLEEGLQGTTLFDVVQAWLEKIPFMEHGDYQFWDAYRNAVAAMLENDRREVRAIGEAEGHDVDRALKQIDANEESFYALFDKDLYAGMVERGERRLSQKATLAVLFISSYRDQPLLQIPYRFLDSVIELDKLVSLWRYRHAMMVSRMIGMRVGTGGSSGHEYLLKTVMGQRVFDDLTSLSSYFIPRHNTPPLPAEIARRLQFVNESR